MIIRNVAADLIILRNEKTNRFAGKRSTAVQRSTAVERSTAVGRSTAVDRSTAGEQFRLHFFYPYDKLYNSTICRKSLIYAIL